MYFMIDEFPYGTLTVRQLVGLLQDSSLSSRLLKVLGICFEHQEGLLKAELCLQSTGIYHAATATVTADIYAITGGTGKYVNASGQISSLQLDASGNSFKNDYTIFY